MPFNWSKLIKPIIACECLSYKKNLNIRLEDI